MAKLSKADTTWKLPKQVIIKGFDYKVAYDDTLAEKGLLGEIQLLHGVISIRPGMSEAMEKVVLFHEIGHGYLFHSGIKEHDEQHLDVLSTGYFQMGRDNPGLFN
jgi:hypothetical protein